MKQKPDSGDDTIRQCLDTYDHVLALGQYMN